VREETPTLHFSCYLPLTKPNLRYVYSCSYTNTICLGNCKQPPGCLWCGGGHLHKECPEKIPILPIIGAADMQRMMCRKRSCRGHPGLQREGCSLPISALQMCLCGSAPRQGREEQQTTGQSVRAPNVYSLPLDKMLKVVVTQYRGL
jgi:hypothetical protein